MEVLEMVSPRKNGRPRLTNAPLPNAARAAREALGLSLTEVAKSIGAEVSALSRFETRGYGLETRKRILLAKTIRLDRFALLPPKQIETLLIAMQEE